MDLDYISQFKAVIEDIVKVELKKNGITTYISAVVQNINVDGTIDVYFPPNKKDIATKLLNKSGETLSVGDSVEIVTKNGSLSNSWVSLKHGTTYSANELKKMQKQISQMKREIEIGVFEKAYPIGSIYINAEDNTSPAILFGIGTWQKIEDVFLLGAGNNYVLGATGGEVSHTLTVDEIPSHYHTMTSYYDDANYNTGTIPDDYGRYSLPYDAGSIIRTQSTNVNGGGQAHNNMPPYKAVNMWIRIS